MHYESFWRTNPGIKKGLAVITVCLAVYPIFLTVLNLNFFTRPKVLTGQKVLKLSNKPQNINLDQHRCKNKAKNLESQAIWLAQ